MFSSAVQPSIVSLFSSTTSNPLLLFAASLDKSLPTDSFIHFLNDQSHNPLPAPPAALISPVQPDQFEGLPDYALNQTVLQIQSPTLKSTYIQCPPPVSSGTQHHLGIKHPWIHLQVRNMGKEWSLEIGIVDKSGRMGILRLSTFQKQPRLKHSSESADAYPYPLLHLPLAFPSPASRPLTAWSTINLHLPTYLSYFSSPKLMTPADASRGTVRDKGPGGTYSHVGYVRVYATCRLRRIWFSEAGPGHPLPWEFELYGDESLVSND